MSSLSKLIRIHVICPDTPLDIAQLEQTCQNRYKCSQQSRAIIKKSLCEGGGEGTEIIILRMQHRFGQERSWSSTPKLSHVNLCKNYFEIQTKINHTRITIQINTQIPSASTSHNCDIIGIVFKNIVHCPYCIRTSSRNVE
jgi:hypothetical protein